MLAAGHEIASHGWRWISYQDVDEDVEREHVARAVETITRLTGAPPHGWYTGRDSPRTRAARRRARRLRLRRGQLRRRPALLDRRRDATRRVPHLVVPYTLDTNDMRFATPQGFNSGDQFFAYLRDAFDTLYAEGDPRGRRAEDAVDRPARTHRRPARGASLRSRASSTTCSAHDDVWVARRIDIARHWMATHPYGAPTRHRAMSSRRG